MEFGSGRLRGVKIPKDNFGKGRRCPIVKGFHKSI
jgi:hypothetical protein